MVYAATRLEVEELHKLKDLLRIKYGDAYVMSAETNTNRTVKENVIAKLSLKQMPDSLIIVRIKQIAKEMNIECNLPLDMGMNENPYGPGPMNNPYGQNPFGDPGMNMGNNPYGDPGMNMGNNPYGDPGMNMGNNPYSSDPSMQNPLEQPYAGGDFGNFDQNKSQYGGQNANPFGGFGGFDANTYDQRNMGNNPGNGPNMSQGVQGFGEDNFKNNPSMQQPMGNPNDVESNPYKSNFMEPNQNMGNFGDNNPQQPGYGNFDNNFNNPGNMQNPNSGFPSNPGKDNLDFP
ncbi:MAG: IST1 family protein [archaeon]|nr:IST1 family protein [archaeon]